MDRHPGRWKGGLVTEESTEGLTHRQVCELVRWQGPLLFGEGGSQH